MKLLFVKQPADTSQISPRPPRLATKIERVVSPTHLLSILDPEQPGLAFYRSGRLLRLRFTARREGVVALGAGEVLEDEILEAIVVDADLAPEIPMGALQPGFDRIGLLHFHVRTAVPQQEFEQRSSGLRQTDCTLGAQPLCLRQGLDAWPTTAEEPEVSNVH